MGMLDQLLGGNDDKAGKYKDFVDRYDEGEPHEGFSDDEARDNYQEVAGHLDDDEYEDSAREAFARLSPDDRRQAGRQLRDSARQQGVRLDDDDDDDDERLSDPRKLAGMTSRVRKQKPDLLGSLLGGLGGSGGGGLGALTGGGGAGGGLGGLMSGGIGKAVMGGIAAMAAKKVMGKR